MPKVVIDVSTGEQHIVDLTQAEQDAQAAAAAAWAAASIVYADTLPMTGRLRTTNATPTELYRATLAPLTGYRATVNLLAVDAGNGAVRAIEARITAKRLGGGAVLVGALTVVSDQQDSGTGSWGIVPSVSGNDFLITVTGAAGRTIDWLLDGQVRAFTPGGR
jgi:hypothetical protein